MWPYTKDEENWFNSTMPRPDTYVSFETVNRHVAEARRMRAMETRRLARVVVQWFQHLAGRILHGQGGVSPGHS